MRPCSVVFRVDESTRVGRGHMARCLALAEALLASGALVSFCCRDICSNTRLALLYKGIQVVDLSDEETFLSRDLSGEIVVVDGYQFNEVFWQRLLAAKPRRTVCIDDLRTTRYVADLVICYNEGVSADQFNLAPTSRLLLGGRYLLLRPGIQETADLMMSRSSLRRSVMLAAGGTRQEEWVINMLVHLAKIEPRTMLWVLSGRHLAESKVLRRAGLSRERVRFFSGLEAAEMIRLYQQTRYLVAPASTLMLEAFAAGCPLISGWVADNQKTSLDFYDRKGLIVNVGDLREVTPAALAKARARIGRQSGRMIRNQRAYIAAAEAGVEEIVQAIFSSDSCD